jgi:hypothetical protein
MVNLKQPAIAFFSTAFVNALRLVLLAMGAGASSHVKKLHKEILQEAIKRKVDNNVAV